MKFVECKFKDLNKGDFIWFIQDRLPYIKVYGYVRKFYGETWVQSKNCIQYNPDGRPFHRIKPGGSGRYFKSKIWSQHCQIFKLQ